MREGAIIYLSGETDRGRPEQKAADRLIVAVLAAVM